MMSKADANWFLRQLPLVAGGLGSSLLILNRLLTPELSDSQARSDVLGVILSALLVLTGLLWQRVQARPPEVVELSGEEGFDLSPDLAEPVKIELAWASHLLLTNTSTRTLVVWYHNQTLLRRGILGPANSVTPGPILQRVMDKQQPVYLVALKLYPGRVEFNYLPENTQGVICQPLGDRGVLILGANAPRSYTKQDEIWIASLADKLADTLERYR